MNDHHRNRVEEEDVAVEAVTLPDVVKGEEVVVEVKAVEEDEAAEDEVEILEITMDQYYNYKIQ